MASIKWDILTIGHLSRNKFWGESEQQAYRSPRCTCTLIQTEGQIILVDPGCPPEDMDKVVNQRTGLHVEDIGTVFLTHFHGDHRYGIEAFPHAHWLMAANEVEDWNQLVSQDSPERKILDRIEPVGGCIAPGIQLLATPGHTSGHTSLLFTSKGRQVVIAADAAMTQDFFETDQYYFNTVDPESAVKSIQLIKKCADIVVPGHDNYFLQQRA
ncbi:MBL fold metallo-hydrolase [Paenibacillus humicola]|uniref:MBL fold metallo-hydrolase n=1 Tax=Paenibacillus humicola TaxID=3110540 RepID=UPI00237C1C43|nr:MBL fold metallo-hydrolase [Paenibacillus humicola]